MDLFFLSFQFREKMEQLFMGSVFGDLAQSEWNSRIFALAQRTVGLI
jgi:hypothetical protein